MNSEQDLTERMGLAAVRGVEDVIYYRRLTPGKDPTPDWRVKMADGRVADIEVTEVTDGQARSLWFQLTSTDNRAREWSASGLTHDWFIGVAFMSPEVGKRSAKELVEALVAVLKEAESVGSTPEEMADIARERLIYPEQFLDRSPWHGSYQQACQKGISLEDWATRYSGYWYPQLLADHMKGQSTDRGVHVLKAPVPVSERSGKVRTYASPTEGSAEYEALLSAIQDGIDHKTAKRQMDNSPGLKWLAVVLEGIAAWQLSDNFGVNSKPEPEARLYSQLRRITFPYFDEVWAITPQDQRLVVLRLSSGSDPTHTTVPYTEQS
ncbi:MAG: hypothetical protein OXH26_03900 [bacterium]|nr:hypothetical protein [bacterium]MDE0674957.1 hypothetical protein [bacterium]